MLDINEILSLAEHIDPAVADPQLFHEFIKRIPKTEIHIHAEATVQFKTFLELNRKYRLNDELKTEKDFEKFLDINSLSRMIEHYIYLQSFFREAEDFKLVARDVHEYAKRNKIRYMELFIAPSIPVTKNNLDFNRLLRVLDEGFTEVERKDGTRIVIIIDVSRTFGFDNAMNNLDRLIEYRNEHPASKRFIGIGLGGAEMNNPAGTYAEVFKKAVADGLHVVAHAGEEVDSASIWDALTKLGAERIGHGTSAILDEKLMSYLQEHQVPLEICPSSNVITQKYVQRYEDHPIRTFFDRGIPVTVNTDDPILFEIELNREYELLHEKCGFTVKETIDLIRNNLFATFLSEDEKNALWDKMVVEIEKALESVYRIKVS